MRLLKVALLCSGLLVFYSIPALANTCDSFGSGSLTFVCSTKPHWDDVAHLGGGVDSGLSVGILLNSNTFDVSLTNKVKSGLAGLDVIIAAIFPNGMGGTLSASNGVTSAFTKIGTFPEGGALNAVTGTWSNLGISDNQIVFAFANLGTSNTATMSISASGVPRGTAFYAIIVNPANGKILYITPNSEAGIFNGGNTAIPEPGSLTLLGTGLLALAAAAHRTLHRS